MNELHVEVAIARPDAQRVVALTMPADSTVADALRRVDGIAEFDAVDLDAAPVGIYGRIVERTQRLHEGDRVEIYRPLAIDPMSARRRRARRAVTRRAGG